jgi:hypothetical protein
MTTSIDEFLAGLAHSGAETLMLLDCARIPSGAEGLPQELFETLECLFTGDLADELADVAPYLGQLRPLSEPAIQEIKELLVGRVGILLLPPEVTDQDPKSFSEVHRHLRKFNMVNGPDGRPLFFRYYDPSVVDDLRNASLKSLIGKVFEPFGTLVYCSGAQRLNRVSVKQLDVA